MGNILIRALLFIIIIVIGYGMKQLGIFKKEDFKVISTVVLNLTLPCAIIVNFSNLIFKKTLISIIGIGFGCTVILAISGYFLAVKKNSSEKSFHMINVTGYNIGCFTIPFAQAFLGPAGIVAICLFDSGNAIMATGGTYAVATSIDKNNTDKISLNSVFKKLIKSPPLVCYVIMLMMALIHLKLPAPVLELAGIIGSANAFLAMLMIGIGFELNLKKEQFIQSARIISTRYLVTVIFALVFYFLLPFNDEIRKALVLAAFSPVSALSTAFTAKSGGDVGLSSAINSLCILISLFFIITLLIFL